MMPPAVVRDKLASLAESIRSEHDACLLAAADAVSHAISAGRKLIEVKESLAHGEFMPWVRLNCPFSQNTASKYMRVANLTSRLNLNDHPPGSINQALRMLTDEPPQENESPTPAEQSELDRHEATIERGLPVAREVMAAMDRKDEINGRKPLNGQQSLFVDPPTLRDELEEKAEEPTQFANWEAFVMKLNNQSVWIQEHGTFTGYIQGWSAQQLAFIKGNLERFREDFTRWIAALERIGN